MFDPPWLLVADAIRGLLILGGLALIWLVCVRGIQAFTRSQRARFGAFALALVVLTGDQVERLGDPHFSWRVAFHLAVLVIGGWGTCKYQPLRDGDS